MDLKSKWALALHLGGAMVIMTAGFMNGVVWLLVGGLLLQIGGFYVLKSMLDPALSWWTGRGNSTHRTVAVNLLKILYCVIHMGGWVGAGLMYRRQWVPSSILPIGAWVIGTNGLLAVLHGFMVGRLLRWTERVTEEASSHGHH